MLNVSLFSLYFKNCYWSTVNANNRKISFYVTTRYSWNTAKANVKHQPINHFP
jgi:hypothetical protein